MRGLRNSLATGMVAACCALGSPAFADAPPIIPVQGVLTDAGGVPVNDVFAVTFTLYSDAGTTLLWSEESAVNFVEGHFVAYLGATQTLDLVTFKDNSRLFLGVKVGTDDEMTPFEVGSAPYAGFAQFSATANDLTDAAKLNIVGDVALQLENEAKVHDRYTDQEAANAAITALDARASHWYGTWDASTSSGLDATSQLPYNITIDKARDTSDLKLTFSSNLRTAGANDICCQWAIRVDGVQCPSAPINGAVYISPGGNYHQHRTITGMCSGVSAGSHSVEAWVEPCSGYPVADCSTGWNSQTYLIAEEM